MAVIPKHVTDSFGRTYEKFGIFLGTLGSVLAIQLFVRAPLEWAIDQHWILGLSLIVLVSVVFGKVCIGFWRKNKRRLFKRDYPVVDALYYLGVYVMFCIGVFSSISYLLYRLKIADYASSYPIINSGNFANSYLWSFCNSIPGVDFCTTLGWDNPVTHHGGWAGLPYVLFRISVIVPILWTFKRWINRREEGDDEATISLTHGVQQV